MMSRTRRQWLAALGASLGSGVALAAGPGYALLDNRPAPDGRATSPIQSFEGRAGESAKKVLDRWALQAGWRPPRWAAGVAPEVFLNENIYVEADFATAVRSLFREHRGLRQRAQPVLQFAARELVVEPKPR